MPDLYLFFAYAPDPTDIPNSPYPSFSRYLSTPATNRIGDALTLGLGSNTNTGYGVDPPAHQRQRPV